MDDAARDAIAEVWYRWTRLASATTPLDHAEHMVEMNNAISDLASWHPDYDIDTGTIKGVIEDDDI